MLEFIRYYLKENLYKAFNDLGLEKTIEVINEYEHLKKAYRNLVNSIFKREVIK